MPPCMKPDRTAEDDDVSSMRLCRYLKLDSSDAADLPPPRKFSGSKMPIGRLTRSQSAHDFSARTDSTYHHMQSQEADISISSRLRECLFMDDFQLLRPSSLVVISESLMTNTANMEDGKELDDE